MQNIKCILDIYVSRILRCVKSTDFQKLSQKELLLLKKYERSLIK